MRYPLHLSSTLYKTLHPKTIVYFFPWQPYQEGKGFLPATAKLLAKRNAENSEFETSDSDLVHANYEVK